MANNKREIYLGVVFARLYGKFCKKYISATGSMN
jgi:hypothetical protein